MEEIWEDVVGYEGSYQVSNLGRVRSFAFDKNGRVMNLTTNPFGYIYVSLRKNLLNKKYFVHRLVGDAFILNPESKPFINHIDGVKANNRADNLEWCTRSENQLHGYKIGLLKPNKTALGKTGELSAHSKPINQLSLDGKLIKRFSCQKEASRELGISQGNISSVIHGKRGYTQTGGYKFEFA